MIRKAPPGPLIVATLAVIAALIGARTGAAFAVLVASTLCVAACAVWWLLSVLHLELRRPGSLTPGRPHRGRRQTTPSPDQLVELERLVLNATYLSSDAHARLRPRLRAIACDLLGARQGVAADLATSDIPTLLNAPGNELLGPLPRPLPHGVDRGPTLAEIADAIALLEGI